VTERRLSRRIPFRKKVKYGLSEPSFLGYAFNLSEDGVGIKVHKVFPPHSRIVFHIYMDRVGLEDGSVDEAIKLEGIVAWISPTLPRILPTMGIKFSSCTDDIKRIYLSSYSNLLEENRLTTDTSEEVEDFSLATEEGAKSTALEDVQASFLDGVDFSEDLIKETEKNRENLLHKINQMDTDERIKLAIMGNREVRTILICDTDRTVAVAVLKNPRLSDIEVILIAQSKTVGEEVLREIGTSRKWARIYQVKVTLVNNPKTPSHVALNFIRHLRDRELQALARNKNVLGVVANTAKKIVQEKREKGN
jgi:hypothetical protein